MGPLHILHARASFFCAPLGTRWRPRDRAVRLKTSRALLLPLRPVIWQVAHEAQPGVRHLAPHAWPYLLQKPLHAQVVGRRDAVAHEAEAHAHALARVRDLAKELGKDGIILMNMCGRGDKDVPQVARMLGVEL